MDTTTAVLVYGFIFVVACVVIWLQVWWALRVLRALETIAQATREGREYTRLLGVEVANVKRQLTG
jgi:hypothetical protein